MMALLRGGRQDAVGVHPVARFFRSMSFEREYFWNSKSGNNLQKDIFLPAF
jgi:hypothetical protein